MGVPGSRRIPSPCSSRCSLSVPGLQPQPDPPGGRTYLTRFSGFSLPPLLFSSFHLL